MKTTALFAASAAALALTVAASAHEKHVKLKDLPEAVRKTVLEQSKGGKILGLTVDSEDGKAEYEAELMVGAHRKDIAIGQDGALLETEERVALSSLPAAVKSGLENAAGKGRIVKIEAVSKNGAVTMYEAQVRAGKKSFEIKAGADGKVVAESANGEKAD